MPRPPKEPEEFNLTYAPILPWDSQVIQYPELGEPDTIELFLGDESENFPGLPPINCLLWRDHDGRIRGILNHYPVDYPPWEKAGNVNVFVQPGWKKRGIGTALVDKAIELFGELNFHQQTYSPEGMQFLLRYRRKHGLH